MKHRLITYFSRYFLVGVFFLLLFPFTAHAEERIHSYKTDFSINPDSTVSVTEQITYDFDTTNRHGIFRDVPYKYETDTGYRIVAVSNVHVTDDTGRTLTHDDTLSGDTLHIKIGDANKTLTGVHVYRITYLVTGAINNFSDHDELYWNAIGDGWDVSVDQATASVQLPVSTTGTINEACYVGSFGAKNACLDKTIVRDGQTVLFSAPKINPYNFFTIVVGFPTGLVTKTPNITVVDQFTAQAGSPWWFLIPLIAFFFAVRLWWQNGRDAKGHGTIVTEFDAPDKLTAMEVGAIYRNKAYSNDIAAEIIQLAIKGYVIINYIEKNGFFSKDDYELQRTGKDETSLTDADQILLSTLFSFGTDKSVKMSAMKYKFGSELLKIKGTVTDDLKKKGYFEKNARTVEVLMWAAVVSLGLLLFMLGKLTHVSIYFMLALGVTVAITALFALIMPRRNQQNVYTYEKIKGLKTYITVAEKARIDFHNAPEKNPTTFEHLLPYAIVLGVEKQWAKQFESIYTTAPNWYRGSTTANVFNASVFAANMSSFSTRSAASFTAARGGSGFSGGGGGGFGGGGGGSW